jgi:hypothetical protein
MRDADGRIRAASHVGHWTGIRSTARHVPESQKANLPACEQALRALKEKG